jgi:D-alanyl-D-alanine carboxypeptidase
MSERRTHLLAIVVLSALAVLVAPVAVAGPPAVEPRGDTAPPAASTGSLARAVVQRLDAALAEGWNESPGGAMAGVWVPGRGRWIGAVGLADEDAGIPLTPNLQVPIGSATKTFTGALVLQEVQAGRLSLDDRLARWYPDIPLADEITIAMLLNMSSGIADHANADIITLISTMLADPQHAFAPDELIAKGAALPRAFAEPGAQYSYSNTNTVILGRILERTTGQTYEQLLESRLLGPLGLGRTSLDVDGSMDPPHAQTYSEVVSLDPDNPPVGPTTDWSTSWAWSAGSLASTLRDLHMWGRALGTGTGILTPQTAALRLTDCSPAAQSPTMTMDYCLGVVAVRDRASGEVVTLWHNGQVFGAVSYVGYYPRTGAVVAILANSDVSDDAGHNISTRVRTGIEAAIPALLGLR